MQCVPGQEPGNETELPDSAFPGRSPGTRNSARPIMIADSAGSQVMPRRKKAGTKTCQDSSGK